MNYRLNNTAIAIVSIVALIAVGLFVYTLISAPKDEEQNVEDMVREESPDEMRIINAKQYVDGENHTIAGFVSVPSPCHGISVEPFMSGEGVELRFTTILESEDVCPQVLTDAAFRVVFTASTSTQLTATWDGYPTTLNLVPAESRESLDEEFYYKG